MSEKENVPSIFARQVSLDEKKSRATTVSATYDTWLKTEAYRILRGFNKKQRGVALDELLDLAISNMSESDREIFDRAYQKELLKKFGEED